MPLFYHMLYLFSTVITILPIPFYKKEYITLYSCPALDKQKPHKGSKSCLSAVFAYIPLDVGMNVLC